MSWIGCDLDGTLAHYEQWVSDTHIGDPIPAMVERVKAHLAEGHEVRILTARVSAPDGRDVTAAREAVEAWCETHLGQRLVVTHEKDFEMVACYDDRVVQVLPNQGVLLEETLEEMRDMLLAVDETCQAACNESVPPAEGVDEQQTRRYVLCDDHGHFVVSADDPTQVVEQLMQARATNLLECMRLADENNALRARLEATNPVLPYPVDATRTHFDGCWRERGHHNCAIELAQHYAFLREYFALSGVRDKDTVTFRFNVTARESVTALDQLRMSQEEVGRLLFDRQIRKAYDAR